MGTKMGVFVYGFDTGRTEQLVNRFHSNLSAGLGRSDYFCRTSMLSFHFFTGTLSWRKTIVVVHSLTARKRKISRLNDPIRGYVGFFRCRNQRFKGVSRWRLNTPRAILGIKRQALGRHNRFRASHPLPWKADCDSGRFYFCHWDR